MPPDIPLIMNNHQQQFLIESTPDNTQYMILKSKLFNQNFKDSDFTLSNRLNSAELKTKRGVYSD